MAPIRNPAIFGMACGYGVPELSPFVLSLRQTGYKGPVRLGSDATQPATKAFLEKWDITPDPEPCVDQADIELKKVQGSVYLGSLLHARWGYYKKWLVEGKHDRVWLLDVRDVIFQDDPFATVAHDVSFFVSKPDLGSSQRTSVKRCFDEESAQAMKASGMPTLDAGIVEGGASQIVALCVDMVKKSKQVQRQGESCTLSDQYLLNHYAFDNELTAAGKVVFPGQSIPARWNGTAVSLNGELCGEENFEAHLDEEGRLINEEERPVAVVHGWDKCPSFKDKVLSRWGVKEEKKKKKKDKKDKSEESGDQVAVMDLILERKEIVGGAVAVLAAVAAVGAVCAFKRRRGGGKSRSSVKHAESVGNDREEQPLTAQEACYTEDEEYDEAHHGSFHAGATARICGRIGLNGQVCQIVRADPARAEVWVVRTANGELHALRSANLQLEVGLSHPAPMEIGWTTNGDNDSDSDCN